MFYITNASTSNNFTISMNAGALTSVVNPTSAVTLIWSGADWTIAGSGTLSGANTSLSNLSSVNLGTTALNSTSNNLNLTTTTSGNIVLNAAGFIDLQDSLQNSAGNLTISDVLDINVSANNAVNINTGTSTGLVTIGGGSGTFSLQTTNIDISSAGAITGATGITMASGNFLQSGAGTFGTGNGAVSLNGAVSAASTIDVTGSLATKKGTDYSTTGTTNDVNFGDVSLVRLTGASAQTITGISGGRDGEWLAIVNAGTTTATISNNAAGSLAANRITTGTGADLSLAAGASIDLVYDSSASLWRVVGGAAGAGGGGANTSLSNLASVNIGTTALNSTSNNLNLTTTTSGNIVLNSAGTIALQDATNVTGAFTASGTINTNTFSSTALTFSGVNPNISASTAGTNISINAGTTGQVQIGGTSTGDILLGGGSGSTGCTVTNASGNFACTGTVSGTQLISTVATGTAPLTVASTTKVTNLNTDLLDGLDSTGFVLNQTGLQSSSNFHVSGTGTADTSLVTPLIQGTSGANLVINSMTTNALNLDSTTTGGINIGTNANAKTITVGNVTGASTVNLTSGTGSVNISAGNSAAQALRIIAANSQSVDIFQIKDFSGNVLVRSSSTGELVFEGAARHTKKVHLYAEYAGSVLDPGSGANNSGTMTSGLDLTNRMNYYKWTTSSGSNQNYDVVVQVPIPTDFSTWASNPLAISAWTSDTTNGTLTLEARDSTGTGVICNFVAVTPGTASTWSTNTTACTLGSGTYTAGDYMTLRIRMQSPTSGDTRLGNITLNYLSRY
jgi:hypothetical protein